MSEIINIAQNTGFNVQITDMERHEIPQEIYEKFTPKYLAMPREELEVTNILCILSKS
jgi:hypothetical protein